MPEGGESAGRRELWYRASLAWGEVLGCEGVRSALIVAHNAVNQALLATALGLPPAFFRRLTQTNAATSVLDFQPNGDAPPTLTVDRINQVRAVPRALPLLTPWPCVLLSSRACSQGAVPLYCTIRRRMHAVHLDDTGKIARSSRAPFLSQCAASRWTLWLALAFSMEEGTPFLVFTYLKHW